MSNGLEWLGSTVVGNDLKRTIARFVPGRKRTQVCCANRDFGLECLT